MQKDELRERLREQLGFLIKSAAEYDRPRMYTATPPRRPLFSLGVVRMS